MCLCVFSRVSVRRELPSASARTSVAEHSPLLTLPLTCFCAVVSCFRLNDALVCARLADFWPLFGGLCSFQSVSQRSSDRPRSGPNQCFIITLPCPGASVVGAVSPSAPSSSSSSALPRSRQCIFPSFVYWSDMITAPPPAPLYLCSCRAYRN